MWGRYGREHAPCKECGQKFKASARHAEFCGPKCRMAFNNRRTKRGGELYDLAMANRFDEAQAGKLVAKMRGTLERWRREDEHLRKGRVSWGRP